MYELRYLLSWNSIGFCHLGISWTLKVRKYRSRYLSHCLPYNRYISLISVLTQVVTLLLIYVCVVLIHGPANPATADPFILSLYRTYGAMQFVQAMIFYFQLVWLHHLSVLCYTNVLETQYDKIDKLLEKEKILLTNVMTIALRSTVLIVPKGGLDILCGWSFFRHDFQEGKLPWGDGKNETLIISIMDLLNFLLTILSYNIT